MKKLWAHLLIGFGAIIWLMVIISLYYAGHKPFSLESVINLSIIVKNIIISTIILSLAGGIGRRLLRTIDTNPLTAMALQVAVGLGLISISALILGTTIGFNPWIIVVALTILGLILWRDCFAWLRQVSYLSKILLLSSRLEKLIAGMAALLFPLTLSVALSPPLKFDALVYHLYLPAYYLDAGKLLFHPRLLFWGMPQLAEILYTVAMAIGSSEAAAVLAWSVGLISLLGILGYINERLGIDSAWISVVTIMVGSTTVMLLPSAYVEWFSVLFGLGLWVSLDIWKRTDRRSWLIWAGIFIGFGLGIKYANGALLIAGISVILIRYPKNRQGIAGLAKDLTGLCLPVLLVALPWLIKNLLATGNPFYPFFYPSGAVDSLRLSFYQSPGLSGWRETLLIPFQATISGIEGTPGFSATIGALFLALCPLAIIGYRTRPQSQRDTIATAGVISLSGLLVWMIASRYSELLIQTRLYYSLLPSLACLAGAGYSALSQIKISNIRLDRIVAALLFFIFSLSFYEITSDVLQKNSIKAMLGLETAESYLGHNLGWYYPAMKAINDLPDDANVLMLWEPRAYYCLPKCTPDEVLDRWKHDLMIWGDYQTIITKWKDSGFTHVLYYKPGADFIKNEQQKGAGTSETQTDWQQLEELLSNLGKPEGFGGAYLLYTLSR